MKRMHHRPSAGRGGNWCVHGNHPVRRVCIFLSQIPALMAPGRPWNSPLVSTSYVPGTAMSAHYIITISSPGQPSPRQRLEVSEAQRVEFLAHGSQSLSVVALKHTSGSLLHPLRLGDGPLNVPQAPLSPLITSHSKRTKLLIRHQDNDHGGPSRAMAQTVITADNNLHSKSETCSGPHLSPVISLASAQISLDMKTYLTHWATAGFGNSASAPSKPPPEEKPCREMARVEWDLNTGEAEFLCCRTKQTAARTVDRQGKTGK